MSRTSEKTISEILKYGYDQGGYSYLSIDLANDLVDTRSALTAARSENEALRKALAEAGVAILEAPPEIVACTLWMPENIFMGETVVEHIMTAIGVEDEDALRAAARLISEEPAT